MKLRRDDNVIMTVGRDKGKTGKVLKVLPVTDQLIVEGLGVVKRHTKPSTAHPRGGILDLTKPISASKVALVCPNCGKPTRIGFKVTNQQKERICRKCQTVVKS